jgi:DNA-binding NarL/FixJ family response regulator
MAKMINTIIADDHTIVREGLKTLLLRKGVNVAAIAKNGREAVALAGEHRPDIIIMDVSMPDLNGMSATAVIRKELPEIRIVALSMHSDKHLIDQMLASGASGYVLKDAAFIELYDAIQQVYQGNFYLSPPIARMYSHSRLQRLSKSESWPQFTKISTKERHVLQLVAEGEKSKDIARKLNVSVKTIESHRRNIMKKLGIFSIAGLTKFAIKEGMVALE